MKKTALFVPGLVTLLLSACAVGPDYHEPSFSFPSWWHSATKAKETTSSVSDSKNSIAWWEDFHDPVLNDLVKRALANNKDLKIAEARIKEARGSRQSTASDLYPQISAKGGTQDTKEILFGDDSTTLRNYSGTFDASWELDLFGGTRRAVEGANATIQARQADLHEATITLIGDVAHNYIEWRQSQQQIVLTQQTAQAQKGLLDIADSKYQAGTGSYLESSEAKTLYKNTIAQLPEQERQRDVSGYRLSVLLGEAAGPLNDTLKPVKNLPKPIAVPVLSAPADIIRNRPDVQSAERELAAATAGQGEAFSELFPKLSLSSFFGINGARLGQSASTWGVSSAVSLPLLDFGRIKGDIKVADAHQQQAFYTYQRTVLNAISDIETSLTNVAKANTRVNLLQESVKSANQTVTIARDSYNNGLSTFIDVLDAEKTAFTAREDLVNAQADLLTYLVALHKALAVSK